MSRDTGDTGDTGDDTAAGAAHHHEADDVAPSGLDHVRTRSAELFDVLRDEGTSSAARAVARDDLVHLHLSLVEHCARRFRNRGEPFEDLVQVGTIGLIKAGSENHAQRGHRHPDPDAVV